MSFKVCTTTKVQFVLVFIITFITIKPDYAIGSKQIINYDEQIIVTVEPNSKLKTAFKGLDLKQIKNLKIIDNSNEQINTDFWDSYNIMKKMTKLESLDISECEFLSNYYYNYHYDAPLPISTLVLCSSNYEIHRNAISAALYFKKGDTPIYRLSDKSNFHNLKEVILATPNCNLQSMHQNDNDLYANLYFNNSFIASYNPKEKLIRFTHTNYPSRSYQIILKGIRNNPNITPITPNNKFLEGVVVADASFADYLPKKISKLVIPASMQILLGDYTDSKISVDTLIVEESKTPLIINEGGLYGLDIKNAKFNRPISMYGSPGIGIFSYAEDVIFEKKSYLYGADLGFKIKHLIFNGNTYITAPLAERVETIAFNDSVTIATIQSTRGREVTPGTTEIIFKKSPNISSDAEFGRWVAELPKVYVPKGFTGYNNHYLLNYAKEMDFESNSVLDPKLQPKDGQKIKQLKFDDPHISDVELAGTNRFLRFRTKNGKVLEDGLYYVPIADNLYLSFSNENVNIMEKNVRLDCGIIGEYIGWNDNIMVFKYTPVKITNGIEYGQTTGFYIVNLKHGEIVTDLTYYATQKSNRKTPYVYSKPKEPSKYTKKTKYHERGKMETCPFCNGSGLATKYLGQEQKICRYCGGKGWYIEHEW